MLEAMIRTAEEIFPEAVFAVHLDHGDEQTCCECIDSGFYSSVMIDASHHPFDENVAITRRVVERAHPRGISVEAELGMLGGVEEEIQVSEEHACLTDPDEAKLFVERTGCDSLACAIGTSHGAYKFRNKPTGDVLAMDRIREIHARLPDTHLVMHGSSSVPQEWLEVIRAHGGAIKETYGVPVESIVEGIRHGVRKVNIDTDIRLAMTGAMRRAMAKDPAEFDPRKFLKEAMVAARELCKARFEAFGCAGQAPRLKPLPLEKIAARYA
jgi:fructose-bisphosphate aldolase class II